VTVLRFLKKVRVRAFPCRMYFFRTHGGGEIDLILESEGGVIPVEIEKGKGREGRWLPQFRKDFAGQVPCGLEISLDAEPKVLGPAMYRVAPWMLI